MMNIDKINEKLISIGILPIDKYDGMDKKYNLIDKDGYKYYVLLNSVVNNNKYPWKFHKSNPYSIDNIKNFIKINDIKVELLSDVYINNSTKLEFKCACGKIFYRTLLDFQKSFYCNDCVIKNRSMQEDLIKNRIENLGYIFDKHCHNKWAEFHDSDGYKYYREVNKNFKGKFKKFDKGNKFTIENIKNYIKLNNIKTKLISLDYYGNNVLMDWECECGETFKTTWNRFLQGNIKCHNCVLKAIKTKNNEINKNKIMECGYIPLFEYIDNYEKEKISIKDHDGYLYYCWFYDLKQGKLPEKFNKSNKFTIENINAFLKNTKRKDYKCISDISEYNGNNSNLRFLHIPCGTEFEASLIEMQGRFENKLKKTKYYKQCPNCKKNKTESNHALVLKQIFLNELTGTVVEDRSCVNPKTGRSLPTDIVNHNLKIAIEIQSSYHDKKEQKKKDDIKKQYWIDNEYSFFAVDIREYSIFELCKIFFPYLNKIPKYIDYNFSNCIDFKLVQKYLDEGLSITKISKKLNIKKGSIHGLIQRKVVFLPKNYYKDVLKRKPIVRLSKDGIYICRFNTVSEANKNGFKSGTINRVLKKKQKYSYDSIWLYEEDYLSGNYTID